MLSKNNYQEKIKKMEPKQDRFSIRKFTVGTASVLIGSFIMGVTSAHVVHADTVEGNNDSEKSDATDAIQDTKTINITEASSAADQTSAASSSEAESSVASSSAVESDSTNTSSFAATSANSENSSAKEFSAVDNSKSFTTVGSAQATTTKSSASDVASTKEAASSAQNKAQSQSAQTSENSTATSENNAAKSSSATANLDTATVKNSVATETTQSAAATSSFNSADSSAASASTATTNTLDLNTDTLSTDAAQLDTNTSKDAQALKTASLLRTSLVQLAANANDVTTDSQTKSSDTVKPITSFAELQSAASSGEKSVTISGNITAVTDLNINSDFTINGTDNASLTFTNSSAINNNGNLTLNNLTINGSIKGTGTVTVEGTVNSNVTDASADTLSNDEMDTQIGQHSGDGVKSSNWKAANISASKVDVEQGATLNINRDITGDGIALTGGAATFTDDGSTFGKTTPSNDKGTLTVGINSTLTINLKDATTASRSNESKSSLDNASAGIRAVNNGHVTTGDSAQITINAGHGRAIVFNEPFGGTTSVQQSSNLETGWYRNRSTTRDKSYAQDTNNSVVFGDSNVVNITGRDGILIGNRSLFQTGDHSKVHIDSKGNGAGLLGDAFSVVEVSPQSELILTSDGKDRSGQWSGGNFIGLGENGQFRVEHDATFKYTLVNRKGTPDPNAYDDNMNIISTNSKSKPLVYVGNNAVFDGQSDYTDYYGEIFAFPLGGSTNGVFQIDGAKYVNWQKTATVYAHSNHGNLYYSMGKSLIDATSQDGQSYYVFKWNNKDFNGKTDTFDDSTVDSTKQSLQNFINSSSEYWQNVTHLATSYSKNGNSSEFPGHYVDSVSMNGDATAGMKNGTALNNFKGGDDGFDPESSQRLVLVATIIPTQEDQTEQVKDPYQVIVKENDELKPGEVRVVQKGVDGLKRTTTTTYYNVDPSSGNKTLDTTKGDNGVETTTTVLNEKQDEIIEVGPQTATINYVHQTGTDAQGNPTYEAVKDSDGNAIVGTVTDSPVAVDADNNVIFDSDGNVTANTIDYTNYATDLANAQKSYPVVISDGWQEAVNNGTDKFDVGDNFTKETIANGTATLPTTGPTFTVVLGEPVKDKGSVTVTFHDVTDNKDIPQDEAGYTSGEQDVDTPVSYDPQTDLTKLEDEGYVLADSSVPTIPTTIEKGDQNIVINVKHGTQPVTPENPGKPGDPINPNDPDGPKYPDGTDDKSLTKDVTRTIVYKGAGDKTPASVDQTVKFTQSGVLDKVTGEWTTPLTWSEDQTFTAQTSPKVDGYHVVSVDKDTTDNVNVDAATVSHDANDYTVTVTYEPDAPTTPDKTPATGKVTYIDDTTNKTLKADDLNGNVGDKIDYTTQDKIQNYENEGYVLVSNDFNDGNETFQENGNNFEVHLKHGTAPVGPNDPHDPDTPVNPDDPRDPDDQPKWPSKDTYTEQYTSTLHYQYADGTTAAPDNTQTSTWTRTLTIDKVTGEVQNPDEAWTSDIDTYKDAQVPVINGYVARKQTKNGKAVSSIVAGDKAVQENLEDTVIYDKIGNIVPQDPSGNPVPDPSDPSKDVPDKPYTNDPDDPTKVTPNEPVPEIPGYTPNTPSVTPDDPTKDTPVTYTKADDTKVTGTQTVHYVDDQGNVLRPDEVNDSFVFTQDADTKQWNETSHKYNDATAPVITGYVTKEKTVTGQTATPDDPNKEITIVYSKIGKIVPVDKDTDKPIPNSPTPSYSNDPEDPTKVVPNEPVPNVPDYRPVDPTPITPEDPTKDTEVPYVKDSTPEAQDQTAQVIYQDVNDPANPIQLATSGNLTGKPGDKINYSTADQIKALEDQGYVLVNDGFPEGTAYDNDSSTNQTFYVTFNHGTQPVTPENPGKPGEPINPNDPDGPKYPDGTDADSLTKTGKQTIHYVGAGD
ncbi:YSIRK-type signal peptide-containing protein, partial [Lactobacillus sp.]|uniref:mucin-binding protein n=1 Tax=Lactobacillus sp. TaxID=1591 RepID=UPI00199C24AE